ncbi:hypothetical protein D3C73_982380 [compost metagenome]
MQAGQRLGDGAIHRLRLRPEQGAKLRGAVLLAPLPGWCIGRLVAQGGQRRVADALAQARDVARPVARQHDLEAQQRETCRQDPGHRAIEEQCKVVAHGVVRRRQGRERHQIGHARQRIARHRGGIHARQPEQAQGHQQQRQARDVRQHDESAQKGHRHGGHRALDEFDRTQRGIGRSGQQGACRRQARQHHVAFRPAGGYPEGASHQHSEQGAHAILASRHRVAVKWHGHARRRWCGLVEALDTFDGLQVIIQLLDQAIACDHQGGLLGGIVQRGRGKDRHQPGAQGDQSLDGSRR